LQLASEQHVGVSWGNGLWDLGDCRAHCIDIGGRKRHGWLYDVARIQAEFTQMQINMFNERAKELSDGVAAASNLVGALFSLLRWREVLHDMARNSPTYIETGGEGTKRNWSAVPLAERRDR
jgi:hypothetical protein